jgi:predicted TPR repeat methyltransferase
MKKSEEYFDLIASVYDQATEAEGSWNPPNVIYEHIKRLNKNNPAILDIGIGTGRSIDKIYKSGAYKEIHGVDVSEKMLDICRNRYPKVKLSKISSVNDIENTVAHYDLIICSGTVEFIEDISALFQKVSILLKTDGVFVFTYEPLIQFHQIQKHKKSLTVPNKESKLYIDNFYTYRHSPHEITNLLEQNNLRSEKDNEFVAYKKGEEYIIYHVVDAVKREL